MAGITLDDVDVVELYDCYTFTVLVTLEDYGFCAKGEGGASCRAGPRPGWQVQAEYRRRSALGLLHVGHDAPVRGHHPGPGPGRRPPGRLALGCPGQRQRRGLRPPLHDRSRHGGPVMASDASRFRGSGATATPPIPRRRPPGRVPAARCRHCQTSADRRKPSAPPAARRRNATGHPRRAPARVVSWSVVYGRDADGQSGRRPLPSSPNSTRDRGGGHSHRRRPRRADHRATGWSRRSSRPRVGRSSLSSGWRKRRRDGISRRAGVSTAPTNVACWPAAPGRPRCRRGAVEPPGGIHRPCCLRYPVAHRSTGTPCRQQAGRGLRPLHARRSGRPAGPGAPADFLIESSDPGTFDGLGLGWPTCERVNPR